MNNYIWVKPYKYARVPIFFKRWDLFGYTLMLQSQKTKRRRVGTKITKADNWKLYRKLVLGK